MCFGIGVGLALAAGAPHAVAAQGATAQPTTAPPAPVPTTSESPAAAATAAPTTPAPAAPATAAPATPAPDVKSEAGKDKKGKGKTADAGKSTKPVKPPPPPPKPPLPNKELLRLKPFTGSWACTGRTYGPGPEHPTSGTLTFAWHGDGFWLEANYDEPRGVAANPVPVSAALLWVFDDLQAGVSSLSVDNIGGSATQLAQGWQGDKLVFEGPAHRFGTQFVARDTYALHGEGQFVHTEEANVNGNWIKLHDDTCTRTAAK